MKQLLRISSFALVVTCLVFVVFGVTYGLRALVTLAILAVLEVSFSFDNAVVNAKVLGRLSPKWQGLFMTIGIAIAVLGMRFLFPIVVVVLTAHLGFGQTVSLALHNPGLYNQHLTAAHGLIAMFGGIFLLMIFLDFIFEEREVRWLPFEGVLARAGKLDMLSVVIALAVILGISKSVASGGGSLLLAGVSSLGLYLLVNMLANIFEDEDEDDEPSDAPAGRIGWGAFMLFLYLEVQDAAFSFDGVSGAFAITDQVVIIAAGLGIGALFVRSLTIYLVRTNKLAELRYLDHGAHWAIGVLAVCLLTTIHVDIPNYVTGLIGVLLIGAAVLGSVRANRAEAALEG